MQKEYEFGAIDMDFQKEMCQRTDEIEQVIRYYLPAEEGLQRTVIEAMNYNQGYYKKQVKKHNSRYIKIPSIPFI